MTFRVAGLDEIKRWALSFGPEANFLKPEKPEDFDLLRRFCYDAVNFGFSPRAKAQKSPRQKDFHKEIFLGRFSFYTQIYLCILCLFT